MMFSVLTSRGLIVSNLTYRNLAPVYVNEEVMVCLAEQREGIWDVWIAGGDNGSLRVKGTAIIQGQAEDIRRKNAALAVEQAGSESAPILFPNFTGQSASEAISRPHDLR